MLHTPIVWDSEDRDVLRKFLEETKAGGRMFAALVAQTPPLLGGGETNALLIRTGEVRGAQSVIEALYTLAYPPKEEAHKDDAGYPALNDDTAWNDGNKLNSTPQD